MYAHLSHRDPAVYRRLVVVTSDSRPNPRAPLAGGNSRSRWVSHNAILYLDVVPAPNRSQSVAKLFIATTRNLGPAAHAGLLSFPHAYEKLLVAHVDGEKNKKGNGGADAREPRSSELYLKRPKLNLTGGITRALAKHEGLRMS